MEDGTIILLSLLTSDSWNLDIKKDIYTFGFYIN